MKKKVLVAMTSSLLASLAFAQGTATTAPSTSGSSAASTTGTASQTVNSRNTALPSGSGGVSTASIADQTPTGIRRFSFLFMNETEFASAEGIAAGGDPNYGLNRFQVGYDISTTKKVIFREDSTFKSPVGKDTEYHITDPFIGYTDTKFAELPGGWVLTFQPRLYLPFGEDSRFKNNSAGGEALALVFDKSIGRVDLEFLALGEYINNSQDYYWNLDTTSGRYVAKAVPDWWSLFDAEVVYNFTDKLSVSHDLYLYTKALRGTPVTPPTSSTTMINETGIGYQFVKQLKVIASVENDAKFDTQNAVSLYEAPGMVYNLYVKLSL